MKRHHDHSNSYKGKHLIGADLQFQRFSPLSSRWEAWQHAGKHGSQRAEISTSWSIGSSRRLSHWPDLSIYDLKVHPHPSDMLPPARPHLLIVPVIQTQSLWGPFIPVRITTFSKLLLVMVLILAIKPTRSQGDSPERSSQVMIFSLVSVRHIFLT